MATMTEETEILKQLQEVYEGLAKVESWALAGSETARNYRYTDVKGASYPVFNERITAGDPVQTVSTQIDRNMVTLQAQNAKDGRGRYIIRRKSV